MFQEPDSHSVKAWGTREDKNLTHVYAYTPLCNSTHAKIFQNVFRKGRLQSQVSRRQVNMHPCPRLQGSRALKVPLLASTPRNSASFAHVAVRPCVTLALSASGYPSARVTVCGEGLLRGERVGFQYISGCVPILMASPSLCTPGGEEDREQSDSKDTLFRPQEAAVRVKMQFCRQAVSELPSMLLILYF